MSFFGMKEKGPQSTRPELSQERIVKKDEATTDPSDRIQSLIEQALQIDDPLHSSGVQSISDLLVKDPLRTPDAVKISTTPRTSERNSKKVRSQSRRNIYLALGVVVLLGIAAERVYSCENTEKPHQQTVPHESDNSNK